MVRNKQIKLTWRELWPVWLAMALLVGSGVIGSWFYLPAKRKPPIQVTSEDVSVTVAAVERVRPQLFSYRLTDSTNVRFFVRKVGSNRVQVAFASCRKCYRSGNFTQDNQVVCGRCNGSMDILPLGEPPVPEPDCKLISIPYEQANGQVVIRGHAVRELFDHRYRPVLAETGQSH